MPAAGWLVSLNANTSPQCASCHANASACGDPNGYLLGYCGDGYFQQYPRDNMTLASMCCSSYPNMINNGTRVQWYCSKYSGLRIDALTKVDGYRCLDEDDATTTSVIAWGLSITIIAGIVAVCCSPFILCCVCCYCCGRCKRDPSSLPPTVVHVMPPFMLQSPQPSSYSTPLNPDGYARM